MHMTYNYSRLIKALNFSVKAIAEPVIYIFLRYNRTNSAIIAYGIIYMYFNSRSYRCTSKSLEYIIKRSHVSIWKWVQMNANVADCFRVYTNTWG